MPVTVETTEFENKTPARRPFRRAVLHGLGVVLPPLLTIVLFLWAWNLISAYVLAPVENLARSLIVTGIWDVRTREPDAAHGNAYRELASGEWIPREVYEVVRAKPGAGFPPTAQGWYDRYVDLVYLRRTVVVPTFLALFVLVLYLLGKFFAAGIGRWIWSLFEGLIERLPVIRKVYASVKQVTDYVFDEERRVGFNRVVAVEYPRQGVWAIAFVTGEGLLDVAAAANEPVLSLLIPTSPVPGTGFTIVVRKSEVLDVNMTVDEAIQYLVSCGVVVTPQQQNRQGFGYRPPAATAPRRQVQEPQPMD